MTRLGLIGFLALVLLVAFSLTAHANQPDPNDCSWDDCLGRSPRNSAADPSAQYVFTGVLRDPTGAPWPNFPAVAIELAIAAPCAHPVILNPDGPSDANGNVTWGAVTLTQGGGACIGTEVVTVTIYGQTYTTLDDVRSPDGDGDTYVALSDLQAWQMAFVQQMPVHVGDLDCDGFIALSDLSWWQKHFTAP